MGTLLPVAGYPSSLTATLVSEQEVPSVGMGEKGDGGWGKGGEKGRKGGGGKRGRSGEGGKRGKGRERGKRRRGRGGYGVEEGTTRWEGGKKGAIGREGGEAGREGSKGEEGREKKG